MPKKKISSETIEAKCKRLEAENQEYLTKLATAIGIIEGLTAISEGSLFQSNRLVESLDGIVMKQGALISDLQDSRAGWMKECLEYAAKASITAKERRWIKARQQEDAKLDGLLKAGRQIGRNRNSGNAADRWSAVDSVIKDYLTKPETLAHATTDRARAKKISGMSHKQSNGKLFKFTERSIFDRCSIVRTELRRRGLSPFSAK